MAAVIGTSSSPIPARVPGENPYYLEAITSLSEQQEIVASSDIYAANGVMLLAKGGAINNDRFRRLVDHKLRVSIDCSVALSAPVTSACLVRHGARLLEADPLIGKLARRSGDPLSLKHVLAQLELAFPIPVRLAVMQGGRPALFLHTLRVTAIAYFIGLRMGLQSCDITILLQAALCHDMGELHTAPSILDAGHEITLEERRFVHVHPRTSRLILGQAAGLSHTVLQVVLQHHERLDGSGYPAGIMGGQIHPLARILAVADVAEAVMERHSAQRVDMLLRVGRMRFDAQVLDTLRDLIDLPRAGAVAFVAMAELFGQVERLVDIMQRWESCAEMARSGSTLIGEQRRAGFLWMRMSGICNLIVQAGFDPCNLSEMARFAGTSFESAGEVADLLDEIDWLLKELAYEFDRRRDELDVGIAMVMTDVLNDCL